MFHKKNIFISHSSENKEIAEQLCAFITRLGIKESRIFCSSIIGQGVNNGEKLNDAISVSINKSQVIVYIISRDFIESSYCMEELGIGWYLSQFKKASCFYLILPDIDLSELKGFVNSKIDKFSFIDESHGGDLGLFVENLCDKFKGRLPKHSVLINAENTFFSATKTSIVSIIEKSENIKKERDEKEKEIETLQKEIKRLKENLDTLNKRIQVNHEEKNNELLKRELKTICERFCYLGFGKGISQKIFDSIYKDFWMDMVNRYLELQKILGEKNGKMAMLLATIYSANGDFDEAYEQLKVYVQYEETQIYPDFCKNIKIDDKNDMSEIIEILQEKIKHEHKGVVQDSYKETVEHLLERKNRK